MPWLVACLIESFAAYGEAMSPSIVDNRALIDGQKLERNSRTRWQDQGGHGSDVPWLNASQPRMTEAAERSARLFRCGIVSQPSSQQGDGHFRPKMA